MLLVFVFVCLIVQDKDSLDVVDPAIVVDLGLPAFLQLSVNPLDHILLSRHGNHDPPSLLWGSPESSRTVIHGTGHHSDPPLAELKHFTGVSTTASFSLTNTHGLIFLRPLSVH